MKYDVYLAGPFFTPTQIATIAAAEEMMDTYNIKYYSPRRSGIVFKDLAPAEREAASKSVFQANVDNINDSDIILALIDDRDTGTAWELGYHYGSKPEAKIVTFSSQGYGANVMLSCCTKFHLVDLVETLKFISSYARYKDLDKIKDLSKKAPTDE